MTLAQTLKQYFDIATETDSALKAVYAESKLSVHYSLRLLQKGCAW